MPSPQWRFDRFRLDPDHASLWRDAEAIVLPPKTFAVLHYLVTHPDRLVTKDELLDAIWPETAVTDAVLRVAIGALRKVLGDPAQMPRFIATVSRRGYRFLAPVEEYTGVAPVPVHAEPVLPTAPPLPDTLPSPEAERRRLTVLFCDLIGSTTLAEHLDPEDVREVMHAYHQTCAEVIHRFDGYIAQYLGDGVLVYFGYPMAHEDDAQRAIWTGLGIVAALGPLNSRLALPPEDQVAVRLGVHTGLVVVGNVGLGERQEPLALGETLHLAARLRHVAAPNTLVISAATQQLIAGYFTCEALGAQRLAGLAQPLPVYRVLHATGVQSRFEVAATHGLTPLVGREPEVALLLERWTRVKAGMGQVVVLAGEAGIGKSRLVQVLKDHVAQEPHVCWEWRSVPYYQHTVLFPVTEWLPRLLQWHPEDRVEEKVGKLERTLRQYRLPIPEAVQLLAPVLALPLPATYAPPLSWSPQRQRQQTLAVIVTLLQAHAARQPVLFIVEDVHWTDPSTLEVLHLVLDQAPTSAMLTVLTCRPHDHLAWPQRSYLTEIRVNRLSQAQAAQMVTSMTEGTPVPAAVLQRMLTKTDGVPLFIEELTKAMRESGQLQAGHGHDALAEACSTPTIPATLQDVLMARLDRLGTAKAVAQAAAVLGRHFTYTLLQAVSPLDAATLQRELGRLVAAEIVYQRGRPPHASYLFKHALMQEAAYESLVKRTRQHYHQRIAHILTAQFPETTGTHPELVAHHATAAGLTAQAVHYWHTAAQRAVERSAHVEAIAHLRQGLALLDTLPETPECTQRKAQILIALGASLMATQGYAAPEVEQTYLRAQHLCHHLDDPHQLFPVLHGLHSYYNVRAELQTAYTVGEQLLTLAQQAHTPTMLVMAHRTLGATLYQMGAIAPAHTHFAQGIALYDAQQYRASTFLYGEDAGVICHSLAARTLWLLGYPDQARTQNDKAVRLAHQIGHPFSLSYVLSAAALFHQLCQRVRCTHAGAEAVIKLAQEQGFPHRSAHGALLCGWALVQQGQAQEGIQQIQLGLTTYRATGAALSRPYALALLAEAHGTLGQPEAGLTVLKEAFSLTHTTGARWYEPELHRLKGALLLQQSVRNHTDAASCFHHAMALARHQHAKALELRAATSLARLWQGQGKRDEARQVLGDVYKWFTEGFDTVDVQDAKQVLEACA